MLLTHSTQSMATESSLGQRQVSNNSMGAGQRESRWEVFGSGSQTAAIMGKLHICASHVCVFCFTMCSLLLLLLLLLVKGFLLVFRLFASCFNFSGVCVPGSSFCHPRVISLYLWLLLQPSQTLGCLPSLPHSSPRLSSAMLFTSPVVGFANFYLCS